MMKTLANNKQLIDLRDFNLNEMYHYNSVLFNFENKKPPIDIIKNIFAIFIKETNNNYNLKIEDNLYYSYSGVYFSINYNNNDYKVTLNIKNYRNETHNTRGLIEYYFSITSHHLKKTLIAYSWDEIFTIITGHKQKITYIPVLSPYTLITILSPLKNSINNHRPTFKEIITLNDEYTEMKCEILTYSGIRKLHLSFHTDDTIGKNTPTGIIINYDNKQKILNTPLEALELLDKITTEKE